MCRPSSTGCSTRTCSASNTHCSIGTTQSAPAGIGDPVAMRTASPPPTVASGGWPIIARPTMRRDAGWSGVAGATSEERTANPSIADEANGGRSVGAVTGAASTQPYDSGSGRRIWSRVLTFERIHARTSSTDRISPESWPSPGACSGVVSSSVPVVGSSIGVGYSSFRRCTRSARKDLNGPPRSSRSMASSTVARR